MTRSMPCPAFGTMMSFFVTFVPIVARYSSPNWSRTNRRTRDVLPTAASPRRTTFTFIAPTANRAPVLPDISTFAGGYRDVGNLGGRIRGEGDSNPRALSRTGLATLRPTRLGDPRSGTTDAVTSNKVSGLHAQSAVQNREPREDGGTRDDREEDRGPVQANRRCRRSPIGGSVALVVNLVVVILVVVIIPALLVIVILPALLVIVIIPALLVIVIIPALLVIVIIPALL